MGRVNQTVFPGVRDGGSRDGLPWPLDGVNLCSVCLYLPELCLGGVGGHEYVGLDPGAGGVG